MTIVRQYVMIAKSDQDNALRVALTILAARITQLDGCEGVELFQDSQLPGYFIFLERWASIDAHRAGGQLLGKDALTDVLAVLAEPPQGRYLDGLPFVTSSDKAAQ